MVWKIPLCCTVHPRGVQMQILCRFVSLTAQEDGYPVKYAVFLSDTSHTPHTTSVLGRDQRLLLQILQRDLCYLYL